MKKLLFALWLLLPLGAAAQELVYGFTGRVGAFRTFVDSKEPVREAGYDPKLGGQLELGAWVQIQAGAAGYMQLSLLHTIERQGGGTVTLYDADSNPVSDAKTRYGNLSLGISGQYFYKLTEALSVGAGFGAKYKYFAIVGVQLPQYPGGEKPDGYYANHHHRRLQLYLPLELQQRISPALSLVGQVQLPLLNKVDNASAFREYDLGLSLGINYSLR